MEANETIGKWAVKKGLRTCWHGPEECLLCQKCFGTGTLVEHTDYSIYENIAPVLNEVMAKGWDVEAQMYPTISHVAEIDIDSRHMAVRLSDYVDLPTTLRDMVAELISKGEV